MHTILNYYRFPKTMLLRTNLLFFSLLLSFSCFAAGKDGVTQTSQLVNENQQKVVMTRWIKKNLPHYPNLISTDGNQSKYKSGKLTNPLLVYAHNKSSIPHKYKAKWKVTSTKSTIITEAKILNNNAGTKINSIPIYNPYANIEHSSRRIDLVLVKKSQHRMELIKDNKVFKFYHIALGKNPVGAKQHRSDNRTPEGKYILDYKKPYSQYHLAVHISYPNQEDLKRAKKNKVDPGGLIFIHGQPNQLGREDDDQDDGNINFDKFIQPSNWTNGCIALINSDMHEFYNIVEAGTPIEILP